MVSANLEIARTVASYSTLADKRILRFKPINININNYTYNGQTHFIVNFRDCKKGLLVKMS